ncbi:MAG: response regulator [Candidatus Dadabacteria bacterium]|nr:MAG: response regulator [Candidatus Dadabacteria bacterium]
MPDILILSEDRSSASEIEKTARKYDLRVTNVHTLNDAREWLKLRTFIAMCLPHTTSLADQEALADLLWRESPHAYLFVYDLSKDAPHRHEEYRLSGADYIRGERGLAELDRILSVISKVPVAGPDAMTVMVVEDLDSPRDIICSYIESLGYPNVVGMPAAKDAIKALEKEPDKYSCVVTDIRMPEIDGRRFIEYIRSHESLRHLPVIALTAYGTVDTLIDCLKAGASGFLVKPPKKRDLTRELARAVRMITRGENPRLATEQEADTIREILLERGMR